MTAAGDPAVGGVDNSTVELFPEAPVGDEACASGSIGSISTKVLVLAALVANTSFGDMATVFPMACVGAAAAPLFGAVNNSLGSGFGGVVTVFSLAFTVVAVATPATLVFSTNDLFGQDTSTPVAAIDVLFGLATVSILFSIKVLVLAASFGGKAPVFPMACVGAAVAPLVAVVAVATLVGSCDFGDSPLVWAIEGLLC